MLHIKNILFFFLLFLFFQAKSQNLVPNPSFENTKTLPCNYVIYTSEFDNGLYNWFSPTAGTSDIYTTLTSPNCELNAFSVNPNTQGNQLPRTGTTMVGIHTYGAGTFTNYREYIEVILISPLVIGATYNVEMYVSSSDAMQYFDNNQGMYFSTTSITDPSLYTTLYQTPQIINTTIITDTENWVKVSGTFTATTAARYLTIGNFSDDANTSIQPKPNYIFAGGAYYFIDDVLVEEVCSSKFSSIDLCKGNSITLGASSTDIVSWALASSPNTIISTTPNLVVSPRVTTSYIATRTCGQTSTFEVVVNAAPEYSLGNDTTLCEGQTISYDATVSNATSYVWQDGSTDPTYTIKDVGYYTVAITNSCGTLTENINVNPCCTESDIPNLITPNGDHKNDTFNIGCLGNGHYELIIYNRWGSVVYQNPAYRNNWAGENVSDGIYYYVVKDKTKTIHREWIQILR